jgi:hypothetical protein
VVAAYFFFADFFAGFFAFLVAISFHLLYGVIWTIPFSSELRMKKCLRMTSIHLH